MNPRALHAAAFVAVALFFPSPHVRAEPLAAHQHETRFATTIGYTAQEFSAFLAATIALGKIQESYRSNVTKARSSEELEQYEGLANQAAAIAVKKQGLTLEKYNEMATAVTTDWLVAEQLNRYLRAQQK